MDIFLQVWGGTWYLLSKFCWSRVERNKGRQKRIWEVLAWSTYLVGIPAVVALLAARDNWIFAGLEVGNSPTVVSGLIQAFCGTKPRKNQLLRYFLIGVVVVGLGCSVYKNGGINEAKQWLEIGAVVATFVGTYRIKRKHGDGYLWYVFMCLCTGMLMLIDHRRLFAGQQALSIMFIGDAYVMRKCKQ